MLRSVLGFHLFENLIVRARIFLCRFVQNADGVPGVRGRVTTAAEQIGYVLITQFLRINDFNRMAHRAAFLPPPAPGLEPTGGVPPPPTRVVIEPKKILPSAPYTSDSKSEA